MKRGNDVLNVWKGLAIICVVYAHCKIPWVRLDTYIQPFIRFAVPLFFMVSGYFSWNADSAKAVEKIRVHRSKIARLCLIASLFCFCFLELLGVLSGGFGYALEKACGMFSLQNLVIWGLFNQDPFVNILWFLFAQLYAYSILKIICKKRLFTQAFRLMWVLLVSLVVFADVLPLFHLTVSLFYYRNFLFFALPYMLLGYWVHEHKQTLLSKLPVRRAVVLVVCAVIIGIAECMVNGRRDVYFGTFFQVVGIFALCLHAEGKESNCCLKCIGEKYTGYIYILHYPVLILLDNVLERLPTGETGQLIYAWSKTVLTFGISLVGGIVLAYLFDRMKNRKQGV